MNISEVEFFFFFPAVLAAYWLLPRRASVQNSFLLAASYLFYWTWNPRLLLLLVAATAVDFAVGLYLGRTGGDGSPGPQIERRRRIALAFSVSFDLGALAFFKYSGFFAESLDALLARAGLHVSLPVLHLALPLGISYYTLQKLGYVLDVYHGRQEACRSPLTFALFTAFFPQTIAGPISRASGLLPQLAAPRRLDPDRLSSGALSFLVGFAMKAYVGDYLDWHVVRSVFSSEATLSVAGHWIGLVALALQIFCDFAGYSFMAVGTARMLGIELPANFTTPFLATSLFEFWRRWHITLNTWLFDYIYTPLTTSRGFFRGRFDAALILTFLASGVWHGARGTFLLWGLAQGLGLVAVRRWDEFYRGRCRIDRSWVAVRRSRGYELSAWALTQSFFLLTLVPFAAASVPAAASFARGLLTSSGTDLPFALGFKAAFHLAACVLFVASYHLLASESGRRLRERFLDLPGPVRGLAYGLAIVFLSLFMPVGSGVFVYGQF